MSFRDQQKFIEELKKYERNFSPKEAEEFKIFLKRHKDEEDFDTISMARLKSLYEKYYLNKPKKNYDHFFKKTEHSEK